MVGPPDAWVPPWDPPLAQAPIHTNATRKRKTIFFIPFSLIQNNPKILLDMYQLIK
jgi:hypothetical protein